MTVLAPSEVNKAFALYCPELSVPCAQYPMKHDRWLNFQEKYEGKPTFIAAETPDEKFKVGYVYCKAAPRGRGYYHVLTKTAYVNLYTRLMSEGPPGSCCKPKPKDLRTADQWDTARRYVYARSRCSRPDDVQAAEQQIDHYAGTKLNPVHGLTY